MKVFSFIIFALALASPVFGKTFDRCSLAKELYKWGIPKTELARWTCIAERESAYRTGVVGPSNPNGTNDYGIFQIDNFYWCQPSDGRFSLNLCKVSCNSLLTDDIRASVMCAQKIKRQQGWTAWSTWKYCKRTLPSINNCF